MESDAQLIVAWVSTHLDIVRWIGVLAIAAPTYVILRETLRKS